MSKFLFLLALLVGSLFGGYRAMEANIEDRTRKAEDILTVSRGDMETVAFSRPVTLSSGGYFVVEILIPRRRPR